MPYAQKVYRLLRYALTVSLGKIQNVAQPRPERKPALHQRRWIGEVVTSTRRADSMHSMEGETSQWIKKCN